ncbi:Response regulator c-di-GMP phosphodiesterase, RpfG family, contains REC and HD-GYP domains [Caenispirillum bisanense]|uniref:Response regulator c-di-GMP phosphodiesterase, RpfG family, contains REC and HD-GYP domains n=2 Tax=Caenispirillum bisanense TaxID=414052 RepID=A0A286GIA2_9PROT|nr:Response regulator c-di-GMP phosphodiesterase, RpfG family, contains REC and HD-GYP domains [Caenispirillum bisanense]
MAGSHTDGGGTREDGMNDDEMLFDDEDFLVDDDAPAAASESGSRPGTGGAALPAAAALPGDAWVVLVVDDEPEVHAVTAMVLSDVRFKGRSVRLLSAHSAREAREILAARRDIAVVLLDVVMETDDAGLQLVRHIRGDLGNRAVRIILRTGQPGQAPERDVILAYDINDYKAKTELTSQKLFTTLVAALRSYEDILALEMSRQGLRKIIDASSSLLQARSMTLFASGVLTQLSAVLGTPVSGIVCAQRGRPGSRGEAAEEVFILAGAGVYEGVADRPLAEHADDPVVAAIAEALAAKAHVYRDDHMVLYINTPNGREVVAYLQTGRTLTALDEQLVEVFCGKVSVGFDNLYLYEQLRRAHQATVVALADLAEHKDTDTGEHVLRVERMTEAVARRLRSDGIYTDQIDDLFIEQVGMASILHDVGKVSVPDAILQKPGKLTPEEWLVMREHAAAGGTILKRAARLVDGSSYLSLGADIASGHHERWDGGGYPLGLKGQEIPLAARIVAVVDVFDALTSARPYKDPWPRDLAIEYLRDQSGKQFDPQVVETFLTVLDAVGQGG